MSGTVKLADSTLRAGPKSLCALRISAAMILPVIPRHRKSQP